MVATTSYTLTHIAKGTPMRSMLLVAMLFITTISISQAKEPRFSQKQKENLQFACNYGTHIEHREDLCYVAAAILWKESSAGIKTSNGPSHPSYGIFQNYLKTVRNRLKQRGYHYTDNEIKRLLKDDIISASFMEEELVYWLSRHNGNLYRAVASYNGGNKWRTSINYANDVFRKVAYLKKNEHIVRPIKLESYSMASN